jgi:Uma2 family endonuclease
MNEIMNASATFKRKFTYREYELFPDNGQRHEIIDGDHFMSPAPSTKHQRVSARLHFEFMVQIDKRNRGLVYAAPIDVELSLHDIVQPDLVVVMNDRRSIITPSRIQGVPSLVVEILSDSNPKHDRVLKFEMYQRAGVPEYWIVEPNEETVEQWVQSASGRYELVGTFSDQLTGKTIDDIEIDLVSVFCDQ